LSHEIQVSSTTTETFIVRVHIPTALIVAATVALAAAPAAVADSSISSNWAGYAVHRPGVHFREVSAFWREPSASCTSGNESYSATWVGLGGYSTTSKALEQIGTEVDCTASGRLVSSAWYELVPAASQTISLTVHPGDVMSASVNVVNHRVTVTLNDLTRRRSFTKTLHAASIDVSSAEWIVEAPSDCISATSCQTLPLADFAKTTFGLAGAKTTSGYLGAISSHAWSATRITLSPGGRRFIAYQGSGPSAGAAAPSKLDPNGSSFSVNYEQVSVQSNPFFTRRAPSAGGYIVHGSRY
jgi:hypothetical protein